jgi:hypothetical protein
MFLDSLLASQDQKSTAKRIAAAVIHTRGADAENYLKGKLRDPSRKQSLRELRLALAHVRRDPKGVSLVDVSRV